MIREDVNGSVEHRYVHTDHLGSVTALTELAANPVVERYSYDAWGLRRNPTTWEPAAITSLEKRGYTGHEHLDDVGMIHMNGRVYSPSLGRMLSPDPVTFAPEDGQAYNRYSYVLNNPLKYTDPSGFQPTKVLPIEPSNTPGPMEYMTVTGRAPSPNAGYFSGMSAAGLAFAGGGGSGGISPGSTIGDRLGHAGNPVAEDETEETEETEFDEKPDTQGCRGNHCLSTAPQPSLFELRGSAFFELLELLREGAEAKMGGEVVYGELPHPRMFISGVGKKLFGKGGLLNNNRYLRVGVGRKGGNKVIRITGTLVRNKKFDLIDLGPLPKTGN